MYVLMSSTFMEDIIILKAGKVDRFFLKSLHQVDIDILVKLEVNRHTAN